MCKYAIYIYSAVRVQNIQLVLYSFVLLFVRLFNHHLYDFSPLLSLMIFCISNNDIMLHTHTHIYIYISDEVLSACAVAVHPVNDTEECRHVAPECHYRDAYI